MQRHARGSDPATTSRETEGSAPPLATKPTGRRQSSAPALLKAPPTTGAFSSLLRRSHSLDTRADRKNTSGALLVSSAARTVARAVSGYFGMTPPVPTALCQICFENVPVVDTMKLSACGHQFCEPCLKRYLELKITEGNVFPVCFHPVEPSESEPSTVTDRSNTTHSTACGKRIDDAQLQAIVDRNVWAKCTLFRFNKTHATARECPFCWHPQQCADGPASPACTCTQCGRAFCFFHGNAHVDGTCADYELKHAESETQSRATIARVAKPCPGCQSNVEKAGGCNHMTCVACRTEFCWICSETLELGHVSNHFSATNLTGCGGRQFDDVDVDGNQSLWARFCRVYSAIHLQVFYKLYAVMHVLVYPVAYALALLLVGITRVRPIQAIAATPFSSLLENTRFATAGLASFVAFVYMFTLLPDIVNTVYLYVHQVKAFGEFGVMIWPYIVSRSHEAWSWVRVRAGTLRRVNETDSPEPEREALFT